MRNLAYFTSAVLTGLILTGCASHDNDPIPDNKEVYVQITATIEDIISRKTNFEWGEKDTIGVTDSKGHTNIPFYATSTSGEFDSDIGILLSDNDEVSFTAYYPHDPANTSGQINFKVTDGNNFPRPRKEIDFMHAPAVTATRQAPQVNFAFKHRMTMISFTVHDNHNILNSDARVTCRLRNVAVTGTFNTATGVITHGTNDGTVVAPVELDTPVVFVLPSYSTNNSSQIDLDIDVESGSVTETYNGKITPALAPGKQYNYNLSVSYGSVLSISSSTVTDWIQNEAEDIELTRPGQETPAPVVSASVGDYLLTDGTILPSGNLTAADKNKVVGVVYYVGHNLTQTGFPKNNGLAIAINDAGTATFGNTDSAKSYSDVAEENPDLVRGLDLSEFNVGTSQIGGINTFMGYNNTSVIKALRDVAPYSASFLQQLDTTSPVNGTTWYLPSYAEFRTIYGNLDKINESIDKADGMMLESFSLSKLTNDNFYWTSTLDGQSHIWVCVFDDTLPEASLHATRGRSGIFRFAIAF